MLPCGRCLCTTGITVATPHYSLFTTITKISNRQTTTLSRPISHLTTHMNAHAFTASSKPQHLLPSTLFAVNNFFFRQFSNRRPTKRPSSQRRSSKLPGFSSSLPLGNPLLPVQEGTSARAVLKSMPIDSRLVEYIKKHEVGKILCLVGIAGAMLF